MSTTQLTAAVRLTADASQYTATYLAAGATQRAFTGQVVTGAGSASKASDAAAQSVGRLGQQAAQAHQAVRAGQGQAVVVGEQFLATLRDQVATSGKSTEELLRYRAAQAGVAAQAAPIILQLQHQRAAQQLAAEAARAEEAAQRAGAAAKQQQTAQQESFISQLRDQAALQGKNSIEVLRYRAAQLGISGSADEYIRAIEAGSQAHRGGAISAGQHAAAMRMLPAQMTDVVTSIAGGMPIWMVAIQQGGQIKDSFGGAGNALRAMAGAVTPAAAGFALLTVAAGALAYAYKKGSSEGDGYRNAIVMTGNAAGTTAGQMADMARAVAAGGATQGAAAAVLTDLVGTAHVSSAYLKQFASTALDLEKYAGQAVKTTVQHLEELGKSPVAASIKLNEQYRYLSVSTYEAIKALDEQGKKEEAAALAQQTYSSAMDARTQVLKANLGSIERGWQAVTTAAKKGWDSILNIGREETAEQKLDAVGVKIAALRKIQENGGFAETGGGAATGRGNAGAQRRQRELDMLLAEQAALQESVRLERRGAEAAAERADQVERRTAWDKVVESNLSKEKKLAKEIAEIRAKGAAVGASKTDIDDQVKAARARAAGSSANAGTRSLEQQRALLGELAGLSSSFYKDWELLDKQFANGKGTLTLEQLTAAQAKLLAQQPAMKAAKEQELKLWERIDEERTRMNDELAAGERAWQEERNRGSVAVSAYAKAIGESSEQLALEVSLMGASQRERDIALAKYRIELDLRRQIAAVNENRGGDQAWREAEIERLQKAAEQAKGDVTTSIAVKESNALADELGNSFRDGYSRMLAGNKDFASAMGASIKNTLITAVAQSFYDATIKSSVQTFTLWLRSQMAAAFSASSGGSLWGSVLSLGSALLGMGGSSPYALTNGGSSGLGLTAGGGTGLTAGGGLGLKVNAKGDVYGSGLSAYRNTVVTKPTYFSRYEKGASFARGAGLMGEAAASPGEGIVPLRRMPGGDLGVAFQGGGGGGSVVYAPTNHYSVDARADYAQTLQGMRQVAADQARADREQLIRMGVIKR